MRGDCTARAARVSRAGRGRSRAAGAPAHSRTAADASLVDALSRNDRRPIVRRCEFPSIVAHGLACELHGAVAAANVVVRRRIAAGGVSRRRRCVRTTRLSW